MLLEVEVVEYNGVVKSGRESISREIIKFAVTSNLAADPCRHPQHVNHNFTSCASSHRDAS
jgi:hypothetical protein